MADPPEWQWAVAATLKTPHELVNCYLWFFSKESCDSKVNYFEYDDLSKKVTST